MDKMNHNLWELNLKNNETLLDSSEVEDNRLKNILIFSGRFKKDNSPIPTDLKNVAASLIGTKNMMVSD